MSEIQRPWLSPEEDAFVNKVVRLVTLFEECNEYLNSTTLDPEEWELFEMVDIKDWLLNGKDTPVGDVDIPTARTFSPTELQHIAEWIDAGKKPRLSQVEYMSTNALPEFKERGEE